MSLPISRKPIGTSASVSAGQDQVAGRQGLDLSCSAFPVDARQWLRVHPNVVRALYPARPSAADAFRGHRPSEGQIEGMCVGIVVGPDVLYSVLRVALHHIRQRHQNLGRFPASRRGFVFLGASYHIADVGVLGSPANAGTGLPLLPPDARQRAGHPSGRTPLSQAGFCLNAHHVTGYPRA